MWIKTSKRRLLRTVQPEPPFALDVQNCPGIASAFVATRNGLVYLDATGKHRFKIPESTAHSIGKSPIGHIIRRTGTGNTAARETSPTLTGPPYDEPNRSATLILSQYTFTPIGNRGVISVSDANGGLFSVLTRPTATQVRLSVYHQDASTVSFDVSSLTAANEAATTAWTYKRVGSNAHSWVFKNGAQKYTNTGHTSYLREVGTAPLADHYWTIPDHNYGGDWGHPQGSWWHRFLTPEELERYTAEPYSYLHLLGRRKIFLLGGGGPVTVTGTIAAALRNSQTVAPGQVHTLGQIVTSVQHARAVSPGLVSAEGSVTGKIHAARSSLAGFISVPGTLTGAIHHLATAMTSSLSVNGTARSALHHVRTAFTTALSVPGVLAVAIHRATLSVSTELSSSGTVAAAVRHLKTQIQSAAPVTGTLTAAIHHMQAWIDRAGRRAKTLFLSLRQRAWRGFRRF